MKLSLNQDTQELHCLSGKKTSQSYCVRRIKYICHSIHYHIPLKQGLKFLNYKVFRITSVCTFRNYHHITGYTQFSHHAKKPVVS